MTDGSGIRTPDQRLRVFVSSTLAELADERAAVADAITKVGLTPILFELGARPHPPQELYRAYLAQSDIFVGLYWQHYGWIGPDMDISGLEDELRRSTTLPRLMYLKTPAPDREERLTELITEIEAAGSDSYRPFGTPEELGRLVHDDLALLLSERFAAAGAPAAAPAPGAAGRPARSLPVTSTSLIGREHDLAEVVGLLDAPDTRLVTLTGPGGMGKTRLAIAVGEARDDRLPRGVVFVPLASIDEPELVMARIAAAVGAIVEGARSPIDVVADHVADTPTLLVLDNLEQVVAVAPELDELLSRCPGLQILATSRAVLRLRAEREYPVSALAESSAVQLFVDRARAVRYDFELTEDNSPAVAAIARRLDGLPLAIELAAARTRLLDPPALLARLTDGLDALGSGPVDLPERQRTLRATVEWSIDLLDDTQRHALADLSVFVDGWTVEAAAHVTDVTEDEALDLVDALAGHSLVAVEAAAAMPRFRMLESVRDLAAEQLTAGGRRDEVEERHARHHAELVAGNDWPMEHQTAWADRLLVEEGNIRATIRWLFLHDITPLPHLFRVLWLFWQMRDRMPEGQAWIEDLRQEADALDDRARAELLLTSAVTAVEVGDDERALSSVDDLRRLRQETDVPYFENAAALALSWILPLEDDLEGALETATAAVEGFRRQGEPFMAFAALTVGMVQMVLGHHDQARAALDEVVVLGRRMDNSWLIAAAEAQLASLAVLTGRLDDARTLLLGLADTIGDTEESTLRVTFALVARGHLALAEGDAPLAATALGAANGLHRRKGLQAWPSTRRGESELAERVAEELGPDAFRRAFDAGSQLTSRAAVELLAPDAPPEPQRV